MVVQTSSRARTSTGALAANRRVTETYLKLVKKFPLIHIQDDEHRDEALQVVSRWLKQDLDRGAQEYLNVLSDLVGAY